MTDPSAISDSSESVYRPAIAARCFSRMELGAIQEENEMEPHAENPAIRHLAPFIGEWSMEADVPNAPPTDIRGRTVFEWLPGEQFLVQRWEVLIPFVPDGIAIIRFDPGRGAYLQHYFDSRGIARLYEMSFSDGVWKLSRELADFSPLEFSQRFTGTFSDDGKTIAGRPPAMARAGSTTST